MKKKALVFCHREIPKTTSLIVAERFEKLHYNVMRDIQSLVKKGCPEDFNELNFELVSYTDAKGEQRPYFEMTKDGFTLLVMGYTGEKAMKFKIEYINAFNSMFNIIHTSRRNRAFQDWGTVRQDGKEIRFSETDAIADFVEYAAAMGSENAEKYWMIFSKMVNAHLLALPENVQKPENIRDLLDKEQLMQIANAEILVKNAIKEGMAKGLYYKDIFTAAKERVMNFVHLMGGRLAMRTPQMQLT